MNTTAPENIDAKADSNAEPSTRPASSGKGPRSIGLSPLQRRIFLVAVASLLPVAILSCATLIVTALAQKDRLLRANIDTMQAVVTAVDAELKSTIAALDALASSSRLAGDDLPGLHQEAQQLLKRRPNWLNVVVSEPNADQVLNARVVFGSDLPPRLDEIAVRKAARTGTPVVGDIVFSQLLQTNAFAAHVPYVRDNRVKYVLTALLRPEFILEIIERQHVEDYGLIGIFDRNLNAVARSLNHDQYVGQPASIGLQALINAGGQSGWTTANTLEGLPVYSIFFRSDFSQWVAAVGVPEHVIDGPLRWSIVAFGGSILVSVLLGLIVALLVGRTVVRPMLELEHSAVLVGQGEWPSVPASDLPEIRRVAIALAAAHAERERLFLRERNARVAAENASKAKDEFLAMLGHELRNPLAAISTASQILDRNKQQIDPVIANATAIIGRQARHLSRLTDDLLDAGRVILGKIALSRVPLDLAAAAHMAIEALRSQGRLAHHHVSTRLESAWVFADTTRIEQVISNLLTNAVKYTPNDGSIDVRVYAQGDEAVFEVRDTGIGMDSELLARVFDLFVQGERALDRAQGGLGIGLTLVRRLVELHDGTIEASSAGSGRGSTFLVRLRAIEPPVSSEPATRRSLATATLDIALIEDNDDARRSMRMLFELDGHRVIEAADGRSGIELMRTHPQIQLAFVDIGLPSGDGYSVARAVRAVRGQDVRLVAMSGYGSDIDRSRGLEAGFDAYLVKPIDSHQMQALIAKVAEELQSARPG